MKNLILASFTWMFAVSPAAATGSEALQAGSASAFAQALGLKPGLRLTRMTATTDTSDAAASPKVATGSRFLRLSGNLHLSGNGHIPSGSGWAWVNLSGSTQLHDETGRWLAGLIHFSDSQNFYVTGSHVSGWARPSASVSVYDNGRYLGTIRVDGNIHVSGWSNNGWVSLSGSGQVSGSGWVQETEPPQTPVRP